MISLKQIRCLFVVAAAIFVPVCSWAATADTFHCRLTATDISTSPAKVISDTDSRFDIFRRPDLSSPTALRLTTNASSSAVVNLPDGSSMGFNLQYTHMTNEAHNVGFQRSCMGQELCTRGPTTPDGKSTGVCRASACAFRPNPDGNPWPGLDWKDVGIDAGVPRFDQTGLFPAQMNYGNYTVVWNCDHTATVSGE